MTTPQTDDWPYLDTCPPNRRDRQLKVIAATAFFQLIGLRLDALETDYARMSVACRPDLCQPAGVLHGGVHAALIDTAVAQAIMSTAKPGYACLTIHLDTKYFKPTRAGALTAEARIVRKGKRVAHGDVTVRDDAGELVAQGWCVYTVSKMKNQTDRGL